MHPLRLFCEVAELRSFSRAAARHSITQSAVSQRIRQLEQRLGTTLLDRSVRPFALTPAGELLLSEGKRLIERYDSLLERVAGLADPESGEVRVDAIYSAGLGELTAVQRRFRERFPEVRVTLDFKRPEEVAAAVRRGDCDFGILSYPRTWGDVRVQPLRDEPMVVACPPGHPLAGPTPIEATRLRGIPLVGFEDALPVARAIRRYLRSNGVEPEFCHLVDNIDTMKSLLLGSVGGGSAVAILPEPTIRAEIRSGALVALSLRPELHRPMGIIRSPRRNLSAPALAFRDHLLEWAHGTAEEAPEESRPVTGVPG